MENYNIIVDHAITKKPTIVYWHDKDLCRAYDMFTIISKTGIPCKLVKESFPEDVVLYSKNY